MEFRMVSEADGAAMAEIAVEVNDYFSRLAGVADPVLSDAERAEFVSLSLGEDPLCDCLLAVEDGRILGYLAYYFAPYDCDRALYIAGLFVREDARSRGLGTQFMEHARALAASRRARRIVWQVMPENLDAIRFYERHGARVVTDKRQMTIVL